MQKHKDKSELCVFGAEFVNGVEVKGSFGSKPGEARFR